jgi:predicted aspartyl protease
LLKTGGDNYATVPRQIVASLNRSLSESENSAGESEEYRYNATHISIDNNQRERPVVPNSTKLNILTGGNHIIVDSLMSTRGALARADAGSELPI